MKNNSTTLIVVIVAVVALLFLFKGNFGFAATTILPNTVNACGQCYYNTDCKTGLGLECRWLNTGNLCTAQSPYCGSEGLVCAATEADAMNCDSTCTDSDGTNLLNKGYVTYYADNTYDYCNGVNVVEMTCASSSGGVIQTEQACPTGKSCSDGKCVTQSLSGCNLIESGGVYTNCQKLTGGVCSSDDKYYCSNGYVYDVYNSATSSGLLLCDLNGNVQSASFTPCPNGCSNGVCEEQTCTPNAQWCDSNNVYKCSLDGMSESLLDTCTSSETCEESGTTAQCKLNTDLFYCKKNDHTCYTWQGTGTKPEHCYSTQTLCEAEPCDFDTTCETGETHENCESDCDEISGIIALTWTQYYSMGDLDLLESDSVCEQTFDCSLKEGYIITCNKDSKVQDRLKDGRVEWCKNSETSVEGAFGWVINKLIGIWGNMCSGWTDIASIFNNKGVCMASSESALGGFWEKTLQSVAGFGIPARYVVLATIGGLALIVAVIISLMKKR
jgi:hypothetical protein